MPATYHPVPPAVWDRTMRELTVEAKAVRLYVLTCPTRVSEGLFTLAVGIIAHDVGLDEATVRRSLDELEAAGLVAYDDAAEVILDRTALRYTPLGNARKGEDKRSPAAVRKFEAVPDSPLKAEALGLAKAYSPDLHRALVERPTEVPTRTPLEIAAVFSEGASVRTEGASERAEGPSRAEPEVSGRLETARPSVAGVR